MKRIGFCLFLLLTLALCGRGLAEELSCSDGKRLTRAARTALAAAQKSLAEEDTASARTTLERFIRDYPDQNHVYVTFTLAGLNLDTGEPKAAMAGYQQTLALCPDYAPAWQNLGKVSYDLGRFTTAAQAFERSWELTGKENHILRFHAAVAHLSAKAPEKAFSHMAFLCSGGAGTPRPDWVKLFAQLSIELKRHGRALAVVERLLAAPEPAPYLFRLAATLYLDQNRYEKAAEALEAYALLEPLKRQERTLLADLNNSLGIYARAALHYETALEKKPSREIYERMASAWFEACDREKSLAAAQKGLTLYPDSHSLWKLQGWILYGDKSFEAASQAFSQAFSLNKKDTKSLFMHGLCAQKAGDVRMAKSALLKAASDANYKSQALGLIRQMEAATKTRERG